MSEQVTVKHTQSFPIFGILGLIFVTLKLCDVIDWSWVWVTAPFWIPLAILLLFVAGAACVAAIAFSIAALVAFTQRRKKS
jgi:hypothetical protein